NLRSEISNLRYKISLARLGRTVSPITWFEPEISIRNLKPNRGWSVLCCTCRRPTVQSRFPHLEFGIWNFRVDAPPLAGSLPFGVRTFLSFAFSISDLKFEIKNLKPRSSDHPTCSLARLGDYNTGVQ